MKEYGVSENCTNNSQDFPLTAQTTELSVEVAKKKTKSEQTSESLLSPEVLIWYR